jgi:hypothetical protein
MEQGQSAYIQAFPHRRAPGRAGRPRLGVRARRRLFPRWAAPSPGVARTEALGIRPPAWSLRSRRRPRPPLTPPVRRLLLPGHARRSRFGATRPPRHPRARSWRPSRPFIRRLPSRGGADRAPSASPCGAGEFPRAGRHLAPLRPRP